MSPNDKIVIIIVLVACLSLTSALDSECTNATLIESIALACLAGNLGAFAGASDDAARCSVVLTDILNSCIVTGGTGVETTYSVSCTNAQEYEVIILYRAVIAASLSNFDAVVTCLPEITCSNITSINYYAERLCPTEYDALKASEDCNDFFTLSECYANATKTSTAPKTECTSADFISTVSANAAAWASSTTISESSIRCSSATIISPEILYLAMKLIPCYYVWLFAINIIWCIKEQNSTTDEHVFT